MNKNIQTQSGKEPIRILHVLLSMGVGGAEKLVYDMIQHLDPTEFSASVCCLQQIGPLGEKLQQQGIPVHFRQRKQGVDWSLLGWLRDIVKKERITVIHAHQYTPLFYTVLATRLLPGVRIVYTEHGRLYPDQRQWKRYLSNPILALGVNHLVSISHSTKEAMVTYDNFPKKRIRVIHNGVVFPDNQPGSETDKTRSTLGISATAKILGTAARLDNIKNLPMMLRAFQHILQQIPEAVLIVAGTGVEEANLKSLAAELKIGHQVMFLGLRNDLPDIYPLFNLFLLSSSTEGISITLLEAMSFGLPTVATDVGGNPEVVDHGHTGFLVELNNDRAMADAALRLLENSRMAAEFGQRGREKALTEFSFDLMLGQYQQLYRQHEDKVSEASGHQRENKESTSA